MGRDTPEGDERLAGLGQYAAAILRVLKGVNSQLDLDAVLQRVVEAAVAVIPGAQKGSLLVREGDRLYYRGAVGFDLAQLQKVSFLLNTDLVVGPGGPEQVVRTGRIADWSRRTLPPEDYQILVQYGDLERLCASLSAPIQVGGQFYGSINVNNLDDEHAFAAVPDEAFLAFAEQAALAIQNALLYQEMDRARAFYESLVLQAGDAIVAADSRWRITSWNPAAERLYGYPAAEAIGQHVSFYVPPEGLLAQREFLARLERGQAVGPVEVLRRRRDGTAVPVLLTVAPVMDQGGRLVAAISIGKDLTGLKKAEAEQRDTQLRMMQVEKLAALGQLVSGVAHELNNPLTAVLGFAELLQLHVAEGAVRQKLLTIVEQALRAKRIVEDLLLFARQYPPGRQVCQLAEVVGQVLALRRHGHRVENIDVRQVFPEDLPPVLVDPHRLQQVFLNLIINAEQAMAGGPGTITISAACQGTMVRVTVADTGPGIPEQVMPHLFEPFFTTKPVGQGTGLGLAISHSLIAEHGGRIWAENTGAGAAFHFTVPAAQ